MLDRRAQLAPPGAGVGGEDEQRGQVRFDVAASSTMALAISIGTGRGLDVDCFGGRASRATLTGTHPFGLVGRWRLDPRPVVQDEEGPHPGIGARGVRRVPLTDGLSELVEEQLAHSRDLGGIYAGVDGACLVGQASGAQGVVDEPAFDFRSDKRSEIERRRPECLYAIG